MTDEQVVCGCGQMKGHAGWLLCLEKGLNVRGVPPSKSSEKVIRAEEGGGATLSDEQVVQQIYPDALEWFDDDGTWFISLPHIGEAESAADAWADARARLPAIPEPVIAQHEAGECKCGHDQNDHRDGYAECQAADFADGNPIECECEDYEEKIVAPKPTSSAKQFRKKPVVIKALLWTGDNRTEVLNFCPAAIWSCNAGIDIKTLEGYLHASEGDWIIKGVKGEFYPCKPDVFEITYSASPSTPVSGGQEAIALVQQERRRQIEQEGWSFEHDDQHTLGEMAPAAKTYILVAQDAICERVRQVYAGWPWDYSWFKPSPDPIRNLVKSAALIVAEIERLQRLKGIEAVSVGGEDAPK